MWYCYDHVNFSPSCKQGAPIFAPMIFDPGIIFYKDVGVNEEDARNMKKRRDGGSIIMAWDSENPCRERENADFNNDDGLE